MDIPVMNSMLAAIYGPSRAAGRPATVQMALYNGDPTEDGVEMSGGGYTRITLADADWNPPTDGQMISIPKSIVSTGAWTVGGVAASATHWGLVEALGLGVSGELEDQVDVLLSGTTVTVQAVVAFADIYDNAEDD